MDHLIPVKPFSANAMFVRKGKTTYKTAKYKQFQEDVYECLMGVEWPFEDKPVKFLVYAGMSSKAADLDNIIKPLLDTYQNIYEEFNDKKVQAIFLARSNVKRGGEYLRVHVSEAEELEVGIEVLKEETTESPKQKA